MIDDAVNIRGLKRMAADCSRIRCTARMCRILQGRIFAVVGGGPGGLSAAYFLYS